MDVKNLVMAVVGMVLAVVMVGGAFLPSVASALVVSGDPVEYTNTGNFIFREAQDGDVLEITRTIVGDVKTDNVTLNGVVVGGTTSNEWDNVLLSDGAYVRKVGTSGGTITNAYIMGDTVTPNPFLGFSDGGKVKVEFNNGTITGYKSNESGEYIDYFTASYTWAYVASPDGEGSHYVSENGQNSNAYVNIDSRVVLCGEYSTGELDTMYYYHNGEMVVYSSGLTATLDKRLELVEGTTDVYKIRPLVTVTNGTITEVFEPYRYLVPLTVEGHKDSGVIYSLMGVLPIVVVAGLIMAGIYVFISRK